MKVWTLVVTDGRYIDVNVFYSVGVPPVDEMMSKLDFEPEDMKEILTVLSSKFDKRTKQEDYFTISYNDAVTEYVFHLKCHVPEEAGKVITGS